MDKFKPTWLYIKQHNVTGLKYFGKTIKSDPYKYLGSGLYWMRHLKEHGKDVTTVWAMLFLDKQSLTEFALQFSKENNIIESSDWANLKLENGLDGTVPGTKFPEEFCEKMKAAASKPRSDAWKSSASRNRKGKSAWNKGVVMPEEFCQKMSELTTGSNNPMFGKRHSESSKSKMSAARLGKAPSNKGSSMSEEQKAKISERNKGKVAWNKGIPAKQARCERCGKMTTVGALARFHKNC